MDTNDGSLHQVKDELEAHMRGLVPVRRDLTEKEKSEMQIKLYSPCGCGSGKKFKFCCYKPLRNISKPTRRSIFE